MKFLHICIAKWYKDLIHKVFIVRCLTVEIYALISIICLMTLFIPSRHLLKGNNVNTTATCKICSRLTIKSPERRHWRLSGVFIFNFQLIWHYFWYFLCWLGTCKWWFGLYSFTNLNSRENYFRSTYAFCGFAYWMLFMTFYRFAYTSWC